MVQHFFHQTKIQVRFPYKPAYDSGFGLTDGSFAQLTLDGDANGGVNETYYWWPKVENLHQTDFWKKGPMGGETRPELQPTIFEPDYPKGTYQHQDFNLCVNVTHTTYM